MKYNLKESLYLFKLKIKPIIFLSLNLKPFTTEELHVL